MSIRDIEITLIDGKKTQFGKLGKGPVLVVNVASRCGLTPQYQALESLQKTYGPRGLTVVGMPSDQFKQELATNEAVAEYCSTTWGVTFPMTEKVKVNGRNRHELYKTLVKTKDARGVAGPVMWNFEKFLVNPDGSIVRFRPTTKPDDPAIINAIESALGK